MTSAVPGADLAAAWVRARVERAREADRSRGASAVEWIVISAIVVAIVIAVGIIIKNALTSKANQISGNINGAGG
ncbi:hypothetical protein BIV57_20460 [Mangrovactinospora gilvigrisea]|uniref:Flp family type IVb pilin n=2 Tax=Mangrovactinospora gilvigrisea TaxID=1428644 RepID=A0A1J7BAD3_9ACTN|nr:hypothetical protein [Mangrovactinospora gilvigrisea]OIV35655.1 hypothetical protein BIV57_20460 [Mangrovactinospora gilvigrisea]